MSSVEMFDVNDLYRKVQAGMEAMEKNGGTPMSIELPPRAINALVLEWKKNVVTLPTQPNIPMLFGMVVVQKDMPSQVDYLIRGDIGNVMGVSGTWGGWRS